MQVAKLIHPECIIAPLDVDNRNDAIARLIELVGERGDMNDTATALELVLERESERTTGIGEGLAVPHARMPGLDNVVVAVGRMAEGVDWNAFDQKPVHLVVLVLSPPNRTADHIQVLGWFSRRLAERTTRLAIYDAASPQALADLLTAK